MGVMVYGVGGKPEEEKTVTAGTETTVVTPTTGYTMKKVTINPAPIPTGIEITSAPSKTAYKAGETLTMTGITVKATFSDGTSQDVTDEVTFEPAAGTTLYESVNSVKVSWAYGGVATYTVNQPITVTRVLSSIAITTQPTTTTYDKGDKLSLSGMVVKATYISGAVEEVTSMCTSSPASGATLSTLGDQTVTITYTENGVTKTASFTVTVNVKTVAWSTGSDADIVAMVEAADAGLIDLTDYWAVGDTRSVDLSAMSATGVGESHAAQTVEFVLMDTTCTGFTITATGKKPSFIVGMKNSLNTAGYMNSSDQNANGWSGSARRTWCNNVFRNAVPSSIRDIFKQFTWQQGKGGGSSSGLLTTQDYFGLAPEKAVFGSQSYSFSDEAALYSQWKWYQTSGNRVKTRSGSARNWWECSPRSGDSYRFCYVNSGGSAGSDIASYAYGLSPFGCI